MWVWVGGGGASRKRILDGSVGEVLTMCNDADRRVVRVMVGGWGGGGE